MSTFPSFDILEVTPSADVATNGTITFAYPAGKSSADYVTAGAVAYTQQSGPLNQGSGFTLAYGGTVVLTYTGATTIKAGSKVRLQIPRQTYGDLVASVGTASNTIPDVGAAFNQTTLNNIIASLVAKINSLQALLRASGIEPK